MNRITRKLEWDSGHRVLNHGGKCKHLHGHRYVAEVSVSSGENLDALGMVVDFSVLKTRIGGWVDENWDHNLILHPDDPCLALSTNPAIFGGKEPYVMPKVESGHANPTAENMAKVLFWVSVALLADQPLSVVAVRLYETPNCWSVYTPNHRDWRSANRNHVLSLLPTADLAAAIMGLPCFKE